MRIHLLCAVDAELELEQRPGINTPVFEPIPGTEDFERYQRQLQQANEANAAAKAAAEASPFMQAVERFVRTERVVETVPPSALSDASAQDTLDAKRVADLAKARADQQRLKNIVRQRMMSRPKMPLFGMSAQLQGRQKPSLPPKVPLLICVVLITLNNTVLSCSFMLSYFGP
jgi:hypothetical protein